MNSFSVLFSLSRKFYFKICMYILYPYAFSYSKGKSVELTFKNSKSHGFHKSRIAMSNSSSHPNDDPTCDKGLIPFTTPMHNLMGSRHRNNLSPIPDVTFWADSWWCILDLTSHSKNFCKVTISIYVYQNLPLFLPPTPYCHLVDRYWHRQN